MSKRLILLWTVFEITPVSSNSKEPNQRRSRGFYLLCCKWWTLGLRGSVERWGCAWQSEALGNIGHFLLWCIWAETCGWLTKSEKASFKEYFCKFWSKNKRWCRGFLWERKSNSESGGLEELEWSRPQSINDKPKSEKFTFSQIARTERPFPESTWMELGAVFKILRYFGSIVLARRRLEPAFSIETIGKLPSWTVPFKVPFFWKWLPRNEAKRKGLLNFAFWGPNDKDSAAFYSSR